MIYTISIDEVGKHWKLDAREISLLIELDPWELTVPLIWAYLRILFDAKEESNTWVHKPNDAFNGETALTLMLNGRIKEVKNYLATQIYGAAYC